jgi:hypothetical protein
MREFQQAITDDQLHDELSRTKPSFGTQLRYNFIGGAAQPTVYAQELAHSFEQKPGPLYGKQIVDTMNQINANPNITWPEKTGNFVANMVGFGLNPLTMVAGSAGGEIGLAASKALPSLLPKVATEFAAKPLAELVGKKLPGVLADESLASLGQHSAVGMGAFAGSMLSQAIGDNYDQNTNHINYWGVAKEDAAFGGQGIVLGPIAYTLGKVFGKAFGYSKGAMKNPIPQDAPKVDMNILDKAKEDGKITPQEHAFYQKAMEDPNDWASLENDSHEILNAHEDPLHQPDGKIHFPILSEETIKNLKTGSLDELASDLPEESKNLLTNFITNNQFDELNDMLNNNPSVVAGVKGFIRFNKEKLKFRDETLDKTESLIEGHMKSLINQSHPISQQSLMKRLNKGEIDINQSPYVIPDKVEQRFKLKSQIKELNKKIDKYTRLQDKTGNIKYQDLSKRAMSRVKELERKVPELPSPKEEIDEIKSNILKDGKLKDDYQVSKDYIRLMELSEHSAKAKGLLYRINLDNEYRRQEAFNDTLEHIIDWHETNPDKQSNPQHVSDYMNSREAASSPQGVPESVVESIRQGEEIQKPISDVRGTLKDLKEQIDKTKSKVHKELFEKEERKIDQFDSKQSVFKSLVDCVLGKINAG